MSAAAERNHEFGSWLASAMGGCHRMLADVLYLVVSPALLYC